MRYSRFVPVAVLAVLVSALVGGLFGSNVAARQDEVTQQYRVFTAALAAIDASTSTTCRRTAWSTARSTGC